MSMNTDVLNLSDSYSLPDKTTKTRVSKWGNSLALRIPKPVLLDSGLSSDDCVEITACEDGFLVKKCQLPRKYDLNSLVSGVTDENRHDELSWDAPRGKEIW